MKTVKVIEKFVSPIWNITLHAAIYKEAGKLRNSVTFSKYVFLQIELGYLYEILYNVFLYIWGFFHQQENIENEKVIKLFIYTYIYICI